LFAEEVDVLLELLLADEIFGSAAFRTVADQDEFGGHSCSDLREDFDAIGDPFYRAKIGEVHENRFAAGRPFFALCETGFARVQIAIDEIRDDFDGALDVEVPDGLIEEIFGDGGDAVALLDGKSGDREIRTIAADQGDVRTVKSGDERQAAWGSHGTGQQGADRMRNGVVDVKQVEGFGFKDFEHFGGEGQGVGWVIEKRVRGDFDFVEKNVWIAKVHANRRGVADEMDVVAARGEFLAEFGGDDTGAAVSGIAGDTNAHGYGRFRRSREANIPLRRLAARMAANFHAAKCVLRRC